jgi:hypothetical protein
MRKLKLAIILPIMQVLVAAALLVWADRTPSPPGIDYAYHPPAWLICKGLNAPVMLLLAPFGGNWYNVPSVPFFGRGLFLIFVAAIWYLVGRALDQRKAPNPPPGERRSATILGVQALFLTTGGFLFYAGWNELSGPVTTNIGAFLTLTWSVSLIFLSGRTLVRMTRRNFVRSVSSLEESDR